LVCHRLCEKHFHLRSERLQPLGQLSTAHVRHDQISHQQVNRSLILLDQRECFAALTSLQDVTPTLFDNTIHCRQPQTRAFARLFGGEERFEVELSHL
jgi:hypothetical protein